MAGMEKSSAVSRSGEFSCTPLGDARVFLVATDRGLLQTATAALASQGCLHPAVADTNSALLAAVVGSQAGFTHLLLQDPPEGLDPSLLDALAEASPQAAITLLPAAAGEGDVLASLRQGSTVVRGTDQTGPLQLDGLLLRYQPIVCVRTGRLLLVEALARWAGHPVALTPINFIPAMERMGLGHALAGAVTRIAARDIVRQRPDIAVSVNLAVADFCRPDVVAWLGRELRVSGMQRRRLCIELTETSPVTDVSRVNRSLRRLRAAGHDVAMDDFIMDDVRRGLLRLPFSGIKLDRSLVQQIPGSGRVRHQVRSLARKGLTLTAEGVAGPALWRMMRDLGVQRVQGFWVARPLPVSALPAWRRQWRAARPRMALTCLPQFSSAPA